MQTTKTKTCRHLARQDWHATVKIQYATTQLFTESKSLLLQLIPAILAAAVHVVVAEQARAGSSKERCTAQKSHPHRRQRTLPVLYCDWSSMIFLSDNATQATKSTSQNTVTTGDLVTPDCYSHMHDVHHVAAVAVMAGCSCSTRLETP